MDNELIHYGVTGQKWGIRRYQNADGTLTEDGRVHYGIKERRKDNKEAFDLGAAATVAGLASKRAVKRLVKYEKKLNEQYKKDPNGLSKKTNKTLKKWYAAANNAIAMQTAYEEYESAAKKHEQKLIDKYGESNVNKIKYRTDKVEIGDADNGGFKTIDQSFINEKTTRPSDWAISGIASIASVYSAQVFNLPVAVISIPKSAKEKARDLEIASYYMSLSEIENANKKKIGGN